MPNGVPVATQPAPGRPPEYSEEEWRLFAAVMGEPEPGSEEDPRRRPLRGSSPKPGDILAVAVLTAICVVVIAVRHAI